ncbi:neural cell adhesion molecule 1-like [Oratosquilla oratoria]|uniref:neural cell adhesion molecule 1-like n=1 Tax=Oratosquilla oratoria TaxID=337810 RepID=UPI003F765CFF
MWTGPEGKQITDYQSSPAIKEEPRIHVEPGRMGKGVDLVFKRVLMVDMGNYTCSGNIDGEEVSQSFELVVHKRIDFSDTQLIQYIEEDTDSPVRCNVNGDPMPTIKWKVVGRKIYGDPKFFWDPSMNQDLIVRNVTLEDAGTYICEALQLSDGSSDVKNMEITVRVHHKPQWTNPKMEQAYSYVSGTVNLTCEAKAEPQANFTWMKDDEIVTLSDTVQEIKEPHKSILQLKVTDEDMFGDYICIADNHLGTLERAIILERGAKPATPDVETQNVGQNSVKLTLDAPNHPDMPIVSFKVQYVTAGDPWDTAKSAEFKKGDNYIVQGLYPNTLYVFRAAARNAAGYSDYSSEFMRRTEKIEPETMTSVAALNLASICTLLLSAVVAGVFL